jgi:dolichyl-phosphate-mannose-protein mannosyltransferase
MRASRPAARLDLAVSISLVLIGVLQFAFCEAGTAFYGGDTSYLELARSIIGRRPYGFDFRPETMLPPGFPAVLALLQLAVGESHLRLVRVMVVATTAAFLVAYVLLRRQTGRRVAAGICVLLAASPMYFRFASTTVFSDMPYFLTSMAALWAVSRIDESRPARAPAGLLALAAVLIGASVLIRTSGVALVAGMAAWIAATFWFDRHRGFLRLKGLIGLVVCGIVVQLGWMLWATPRQFSEWPVGGYPKPYLAQLTVKNGNQPDLGYASLSDIPARIAQNLTDRAAALDYLTTGKTGSRLITPRWFLPWIFGPIALVAIGLFRSVRQSGGTLAEWYFIAHEAIYLLWPWDFESRFFLPVAPLACLYAWRGARDVVGFMRQQWAWPALTIGPAMARGAVAVLCLLIANGLVRQIDVARENRAFNLSLASSYPDIQAAEWIHTHVPQGSVVMARQWDVAYHYAARKVVWFPPTTDADLLLHGILKYHVDYVVVVRRGLDSYWRPDDDRCFQSLVDRYPHLFAVVQAGTREKVYAVTIRRS